MNRKQMTVKEIGKMALWMRQNEIRDADIVDCILTIADIKEEKPKKSKKKGPVTNSAKTK